MWVKHHPTQTHPHKHTHPFKHSHPHKHSHPTQPSPSNTVIHTNTPIPSNTPPQTHTHPPLHHYFRRGTRKLKLNYGSTRKDGSEWGIILSNTVLWLGKNAGLFLKGANPRGCHQSGYHHRERVVLGTIAQTPWYFQIPGHTTYRLKETNLNSKGHPSE